MTIDQIRELLSQLEGYTVQEVELYIIESTDSDEALLLASTKEQIMEDFELYTKIVRKDAGSM